MLLQFCTAEDYFKVYNFRNKNIVKIKKYINATNLKEEKQTKHKRI